MANRYANLVGSNKIKDEYGKINDGFDAVQADIDARMGFAHVNNVDAHGPDDTLTIEGGTGITVTTNPTTQKVIVTATGTSTPGAHGSSHASDGADPVPDATTTASGLLSPTGKKLIDQWADYMSRQAIINGNFDLAQRGTSFTDPTSFAYTIDRWKVVHNADGGTLPTVVHTQEALTPGDLPGAYHYYRIAVDGAGSGYGANASYRIGQIIEQGCRYLCGNGKKITLSFWARSDIADKRLGVLGQQQYGTGGSPSVTENYTGQIINLTSNWTRYTVTYTTNTLAGKTFGSNRDDALIFYFFAVFGASSVGGVFGDSETFRGAGNIEIAQVAVCAGDFALPFAPRTLADGLHLCQRHYRKSFGVYTAPAQNTGVYEGAVVHTALTTGTDQVWVDFGGRMRVAPTITTYNPGASNGSWRNTTDNTDLAASITQVSDRGFIISGSFTAGKTYYIHWSADAEL